MQVKTNVKAGGISMQHNEARVRPAARDLRTQTGVKGGALPSDPGDDGRPGLRVQTGVKAGFNVKKTTDS